MKNYFRTILLVCFIWICISPSWAQNLPSRSKVNENQDRVWVEIDEGYMEAFVVNNVKKMPLVNNKFYYSIYKGRLQVLQGGSWSKMLHGEAYEWYSDHVMKSRGDFKKGLKDGVWKYWFANGKLNKVEKWKRGILVNYIDYDEDGHELEKIKIHEGKFVKKIKFLYNNVVLYIKK